MDDGKSSGSIAYTYDASGNRINKTSGSTVTTYVRDAQGNVMAVYQKAGAAALKKTESHIYGSSRLGIAGGETVAPVDVLNSSNQVAGRRITFTRGEKAYELTNHLGNVAGKHL